MKLRQNQGGQALMIVLLALAAVASVALTVSTRSTTDVAVTTNVEESQRAFTAAEAGVEKMLLSPKATIAPQSVGDAGATFTASSSSIPEDENAYAYPFEQKAGDVATLWFMSHDPSTSMLAACSVERPCYTGSAIRICWGNPETEGIPTTATQAGALEVTVYNEDSTGKIIANRTTIDGDASRRSDNKFSAPASGTCADIDGQGYAFNTLVTFSDLGITDTSSNKLKMMRVRLLYNNDPQPIGFRTDGRGSLPIQGIRVESLGSAGTSLRRLEAFSLYPVVPSMFEAALFSPPGVVKN